MVCKDGSCPWLCASFGIIILHYSRQHTAVRREMGVICPTDLSSREEKSTYMPYEFQPILEPIFLSFSLMNLDPYQSSGFIKDAGEVSRVFCAAAQWSVVAADISRSRVGSDSPGNSWNKLWKRLINQSNLSTRKVLQE